MKKMINKENLKKIKSVCCKYKVHKAMRRIGKLEYICDKCGKHCEIKIK